MRHSLLLLLAIAGCGSTVDPCDGIAGVCISARVDGDLADLDQLRVINDQSGMMRSVLTPDPAEPFSLPIRVAIVPQSSTPAAFNLRVQGLLHGVVVEQSASMQITIGSGRTSYDFHLDAVHLDGGTDASGDGPPPAVISVTPPTFDFPATPRGTVSTIKAMMTLTNNTSGMRTTTSVTTTGDGDAFQIDPTTTCPIANMSSVMVPTGSCILVFIFQPMVSGMLSQTNTVMFDDGESLSFTLRGTATPVWVNETISALSGTTWHGVWGASHNAVYIVGGDSNSNLRHIYVSDGKGHWNSSEQGIITTGGLNAVWGSSATDVYAGGTNGDIFHLGSGNTWMFLRGAGAGNGDAGISPSSIRSIWGTSATEVYAVGDSETLLLGPASWLQQNISPAFTGSITAVTAGELGAVRAVTDTGRDPGAGGSGNWNNNPTATGAPPLTAVFFHNLTSWSVGGNGFIQKGQNSNFTVETPPAVTGFTPNLTGIAGRLDANGMLTDLWVVGSLGSQIWHSTGNGVWDNSQHLPNNQAAYAVFVTPDTGEIYVAQGNGQISHYY